MSPLLLSRAFYFFYYAALAALSPFLVLYYQRLGYTGTEIGILRGISPLIMLVSAPLWGVIADATRQHKRILLVAIGCSIALVFGLSITAQYTWLMVIVSLFAFFGAPIISLIDNSVIQLLQGQRDKYGRQRLWGAVGWGIAAPLAGYLSHQIGLSWIFYCYLVLMAGAWIVAYSIPISQSSFRAVFWSDIRTLISNRQWVFFLLSILFGSLHLSIANTYLILHLNALGVNETLIGLSLTLATLSELPMWFFSNAMLRKWQPKGMLIFSFIACAIQAVGYAYIRVPWIILAFQFLHGPSFSAMWSAGVAYAADISTETTRATAQGMFGGITMGLRAAIGTFIGGLIYDSAGASMTFLFGGLTAIIGLIIFIMNTPASSRHTQA